MEGIHPTKEGTKKLIQAINSVVPIIHNEKFITSERSYQGVEDVFKYGCIHCHRYLDLDRSFRCPQCLLVYEPATPSEQPSDSAVVSERKLVNLYLIEFNDIFK